MTLQLTLPDGQGIDSVAYTLASPSATVQAGSISTHDSGSISFQLGNVPAGDGYTITLDASPSGGGTCLGQSAPFTVAGHSTTIVQVPLACYAPGIDAGNVLVNAIPYNCATWTSLATVDPTHQGTNGNEANVGSAITLIATATGHDPSNLSYSWSSSADIGTFSNNSPSGTSDTVTFTCTAVGTATITLVVADGPVPDGGSCDKTLSTVTTTVECDPPPCAPDQTSCAGVCVNTQTDGNNCGGCGIACTGTDTCQQGMCAPQPCNAGLTLCDGFCVNTQTNVGNCGGCGIACMGTDVCQAGACGPQPCPQGQSLCNGICIPTEEDPNNCGGCGIVCPAGNTCQQAVCQPPPPAGKDVVVFNDVNPFDNGGMTNPNNPILVSNLVNFTTDGPRSSSTVVWMDHGHGSKCGGTGECDASSDATMYSVIQMNGLTVQDISSTSGSLTSFDPAVKVIFLWNPLVPYTVDEINAFKRFASEGGRVVFVGEWDGYYGSGIALENQFLHDMGAQMTNIGQALDCGYTDLGPEVLRPEEITTGMNGVRVACASVIVPGPNDFPLFFDSTNTSLLAGVASISLTPITGGSSPVPPVAPALARPALVRPLNPASSTGF